MPENENFGILNFNSGSYKTRLSRKFITRKPYSRVNPKIIVSFIPGTIIDVLVKEGEEVKKGDYILILDAMKMQNKLMSHSDGTIKKIHVSKGDKVPKGRILLELI
jgi:biotin carboxyl carrier protein